MTLKKVVRGLVEELETKTRQMEKFHYSSRRVIILSKQAVMAIHRHDLAEAKSKLTKAKTLLSELEFNLPSYPDLPSGGWRTAYQEYTEAKILLASLEGKDFPLPVDLGIPTIPYILGLADTIGEFRRTSVDALRRGTLIEAEKGLQTMEDIYQELIPLQDFYTLIPDLRHKIDVARRLIELTFSDVSSETRLVSLKKAISLLEKRIEAKQSEDRL